MSNKPVQFRLLAGFAGKIIHCESSGGRLLGMNNETERSDVFRFFAGLTEYAFHCRLGVVDPKLVSYLTVLLTRFVAQNEVYRLRSTTGKRLDQVADMLSEAQARQGTAKREVHRHIGDYTLFWLGVYPEAVEQMRKSSRKDSLLDYWQRGKSSYEVASRIPTDRKEYSNDVLEKLSQEFELCAYGLGEVRREWERREGDGEAQIPLWFVPPRDE